MLSELNTSLNKYNRGSRAYFHDYRGPGYYLITYTSYPDRMRLSEIIDPGDRILPKDKLITPSLSPLGIKVKEAIDKIHPRIPKMRIPLHIIMPDHIHFILQVTDYLDKPIGVNLAPFAVECSKAFNNLNTLPTFTTLFQPFDDVIIFNYLHLQRAFNYVADNPRRLIMRRRYPDLFHRFLHLGVDNFDYAGYGNLYLLQAPSLLPVRIHRRWSPQEFEAYRQFCRQAIKYGATPITPAIHPVEKEIVKEALDAGSSLILLREQSFDARFKPQGRFFDLCIEGRLLLLSPWPDNFARRQTGSYAIFHTMNDHAAHIASLSPEARLVIRNL